MEKPEGEVTAALNRSFIVEDQDEVGIRVEWNSAAVTLSFIDEEDIRPTLTFHGKEALELIRFIQSL